MIDELNLDPIPDLPEELAEIDAELRDIGMAERPSFGPELKAELERVWRSGPEPLPTSAGTRRAVAAAIGAILLVGMLAPPSRTALAEMTRESLRWLGVTNAPAEVSPEARRRSEPPAAVGLQLAPPPQEERTAAADRGPLPPVLAGAVSPPEEAAPTREELPRFEPVESTMPELVDRNADEAAIRRYYPPELEEEGIGGSVSVRLWVDSTGATDNIAVTGSSGYPAMDRAALQAARELRFRPARRGDRPVGTLVEFDMQFEPRPSPRRLVPVDVPEPPFDRDGDLQPTWAMDVVVPAPYRLETRELLRASLGRRADLERRFGSVENLLAGESPPGASPSRWRASASQALEAAMARDPDNPAPYLALGRLRKRQGLRAEALALFNEGAARVAQGSVRVPPGLGADLDYERGKLFEHEWLGVRNLGRIPTGAVSGVPCAQGWHEESDVDHLVGINYLCPDRTRSLMEDDFRVAAAGVEVRNRMRDAFEAAVSVEPEHVGANVGLLLDRAEAGEWRDLLDGARSFAWASGGHPWAMLLSGLALQRLGRPAEAMADFELALRVLPPEEAHAVQDLGPLLSEEERAERMSLEGEALEAWDARYWRLQDPVRLTEVNEREVEHLARTTWALLRFGGPDTEVGDIWIRYGRPDTVRVLGWGTELRTEFWDYGRGPSLTFRRPAQSREPYLTSEARAYLSDLSALLPYRYGVRSDRVTSLSAQVSRFRARGDAPAELAVHTRVPAEMGTSATDSVHLGLFVMGADGEVLSRLERALPAAEVDIRVEVPVPERGERFAVELVQPATGRVAATRGRATRTAAEDEDPRISDLVLTESALPLSRAIPRRAPWIVPLTDPLEPAPDVLGVLFELYVPGGGPYRLSARLETLDGSASVRVPVRPSGEERYEVEWARTPVPDAPEFLSLDLSDVEPGTYTLRVLVEVDGLESPIVGERTIQR